MDWAAGHHEDSPKPARRDNVQQGRPDDQVPGGLEGQVERHASWFRRCLVILGPGLTGGAASNDPSAITTYARAGALLGFAVLWVVPLLFPMMAVSVYLCAKLAMVSGRSLAGILREHYSRWLLIPIVSALVLANTFNAGADLGAVAAGIAMLLAVPQSIVIVAVTVFLLIFQIWGSYQLIVNVFKWLTLTLFAFVGAGLLARPDAADVLIHTVVPTIRFEQTFLSILVGMLGASLSPYLFIWQTGQRVEEEISAGRSRIWQRRGATPGELKYASWDINAGMFFACVIIYFIILATAATLHLGHERDIREPADAAQALRPFAGPFASILFAMGFIGAGLLAVPVLTTGAAYALAETFGWKYGLGRRPTTAPQFYLAIVVVTVAGMLINFIGLNVMTALFLAAVFNGVLTPIVLSVIMHASGRPSIMGPHKSRRSILILGWLSCVFVAAVTMAMLLSL